MKSFTTNMMVAAAALMVVAGSASAQQLKAQIPFAFSIGSQRLDPGMYNITVKQAGSATLVTLYNAGEHNGAMSSVVPGKDAPREWVVGGKAMLSFACAGGHCALRGLWDGGAVATMSFPASRDAKSELAGVEIVNIRVAKAD